MSGLSYSPDAEQDLAAIWFYIARDNVAAADRWIARIRERCSMIRFAPDAGTPRPDLSPGIRTLPIGSYIVFFRRRGEEVEISRVLHGARDVARLFDQ